MKAEDTAKLIKTARLEQDQLAWLPWCASCHAEVERTEKRPHCYCWQAFGLHLPCGCVAVLLYSVPYGWTFTLLNHHGLTTLPFSCMLSPHHIAHVFWHPKILHAPIQADWVQWVVLFFFFLKLFLVPSPPMGLITPDQPLTSCTSLRGYVPLCSSQLSKWGWVSAAQTW